MMGYEGVDLPLTGVAGQRSGRRPVQWVQAVGGGLVGRRLWFSDVSAVEAEDRRTTGLTATFFTFTFLPTQLNYRYQNY